MKSVIYAARARKQTRSYLGWIIGLFVIICIVSGMISEARAYQFWPRYELTEAQKQRAADTFGGAQFIGFEDMMRICGGRAHGCFIPPEEDEEWGIFVADWLKPAWTEAVINHELTHAHEHIEGVPFKDAVAHKGWLGGR